MNLCRESLLGVGEIYNKRQTRWQYRYNIHHDKAIQAAHSVLLELEGAKLPIYKVTV